VIFNDNAYANGDNLKQWARQEYKWGGVYSPSDNKPRFLALDAFSAHKQTSDETKAQEDFVAELKKLNCTISMIPPGGTGYVQVCDTTANQLIKKFISESEEAHYDSHEMEYKTGRFTVGDRRVLLAEWTLDAYNKLHEEHRDLIIKGFEQVGMSLNPDGSED
jgi:hypothetical protein